MSFSEDVMNRAKVCLDRGEEVEDEELSLRLSEVTEGLKNSLGARSVVVIVAPGEEFHNDYAISPVLCATAGETPLTAIPMVVRAFREFSNEQLVKVLDFAKSVQEIAKGAGCDASQSESVVAVAKQILNSCLSEVEKANKDLEESFARIIGGGDGN